MLRRLMMVLTGTVAMVAAAEPVKPAADVELFNGKDLAGWTPSLKGRVCGEDPLGVFRVTDGALVVSGAENGAIITDQSWKDYRLTVEYRWLGNGPGAEKGEGGDSGILLHVNGDPHAFCGAWPISFECNLILGRTGDLCLLAPAATVGSQSTSRFWSS